MNPYREVLAGFEARRKRLDDQIEAFKRTFAVELLRGDDDGAAGVTVTHQEEMEVDPVPLRESVMDACLSFGAVDFDVSAVVALFPTRKQKDVGMCLARLCDAGKLQRVNRWTYRLAPEKGLIPASQHLKDLGLLPISTRDTQANTSHA